MYDTGTIRHGYIIITFYKIGFLVLLFNNRNRAGIKRFIFPVFQILPLHGLQYFICRLIILCQFAQYRIQKCLCQIICISVSSLDLCINFFRIYAKCHVGRKCPRRCRPCKEICIFILTFKANHGRSFLDCLITLRNLMRRKRCSAAGAVRNYLKAFIKKIFIPDGLQCPPF